MRLSSSCALVLAAALAAACTKDNPHACAELDPCTDPARPYCDLAGNFGDPGTCIAVDCTAGETVACSGDHAVQCVAAGNNYQDVLCERGCNPATTGCRLCDPNETACTNGTVATCDASGAVVSSTACPLGCFEDEPRCRAVDPSNDLAEYLDAAATAVAADLPDNTVIDPVTGTITPPDAGALPIASFLVPAPAGGVPVRVFVVGSVANPASLAQVPAIAFVSARDVELLGEVDLTDPVVTPGSILTGACVGENSVLTTEASNRRYGSGGGGGGSSTEGGAGGYIDFDGAPLAASAPGDEAGNPVIVPLRGGCAGGDAFDNGGAGGAALQIVSGTRIQVAGTINANGQAGGQNQDTVGGGGSGGAILLEAPVVELGPDARLLANGGNGRAGDGSVPPTSTTTEPAPDAQCATPSDLCGDGGAGGTAAAGPNDGSVLLYTNLSNVRMVAGGGGGAAGYIRINTAAGTYELTASTIISPAASPGTVATR